jgi:paraquat-inducible protein B
MSYGSPDLREQILGASDTEKLERFRRMVANGLRATLEQQSFVTGQLQVALDYYPNAEPATVELHDDLPVMPTIQSGFSKLAAELEEVPLREIVRSASEAIEGIAAAVNSPEAKTTLDSLAEAMQNVEDLLEKVDARIDPLLTSVDEGLSEFRTLVRRIDASVDPLVADADGTMDDLRALLQAANDRIGPLADGVEETTTAATRALQEATSTLAAARGLVPENSALAYQLTTTMEALTGALDAVKDLASYLERHPEALLRGK